MQFSIRSILLATLAVAIWCKAAPVLFSVTTSAVSIYSDWNSNRIMHERVKVINANAGRPTVDDKLKF